MNRSDRQRWASARSLPHRLRFRHDPNQERYRGFFGLGREYMRVPELVTVADLRAGERRLTARRRQYGRQP